MSDELESIRRGIDKIDGKIVKLLRQRSTLVSAAGKLKKSEDAVRDSARVEKVIEKVRAIAVAEGLDPKVAEKVYRTMIDAFIAQEMGEWEEMSEEECPDSFKSPSFKSNK